MTPERDHRHGRKKGKILRSCGEAEPDVIHISWKCKQFQQLRSQALALPKALLILGLLFASNMPPSCPLIQSTLATIWQRRMRSVFHQIHPIQKVHMRWLNTNQLRAAKGFFFKAVAKKWSFLSFFKHQRLKITNKPCKDICRRTDRITRSLCKYASYPSFQARAQHHTQ